MALELLDDVGPHVAAAQDRQDLEQAGDGRARAELGRLVDVEQRLLVEKLDPQERAHPLRQRLLERDQAVLGCERRKLGGRVHAAILRDRARARQTSFAFVADARLACRELDVAPMQLRDLSARGLATSPLLSITSCAARRRVARSACAAIIGGRFGARHAVAPHQPFELQSLGAVDDERSGRRGSPKSVSTSSGTATIAYGRRDEREPLERPCAYQRVQQAVEDLAFRGVREYQPAQRRAVELPLVVSTAGAEGGTRWRRAPACRGPRPRARSGPCR